MDDDPTSYWEEILEFVPGVKEAKTAYGIIEKRISAKYRKKIGELERKQDYCFQRLNICSS